MRKTKLILQGIQNEEIYRNTCLIFFGSGMDADKNDIIPSVYDTNGIVHLV